MDNNHNDVGNFIVFANGRPFVIDVGRPTYTRQTFSSDRYKIWSMQSDYHNLPTVNGQMQEAGRDFMAKGVKYEVGEGFAQLSADSRIISADNNKVTFRYKGSGGVQTRTMTVSVQEFIRRFLQHVLPAGVHKVRYYGLWSSSNRKKLLEVQEIPTQSGNDQQVEFKENVDVEAPQPSEARKCPHCQRGTFIWRRCLPRKGRAPP
jgi:hypothetical protein